MEGGGSGSCRVHAGTNKRAVHCVRRPDCAKWSRDAIDSFYIYVVQTIGRQAFNLSFSIVAFAASAIESLETAQIVAQNHQGNEPKARKGTFNLKT